MKLQEYQAADIFQQAGIPVAEGYLVTRPDEIRDVTKPVVLKAQVRVGKRGKHGGILFAETRQEAIEKTGQLLNMQVRGLDVDEVLVAEKAEVQREYYVGMVMDRESRRSVLIMTSEGGMDIEKVATEHPDRIAKHPVDPILGLRRYEAMYLAEKIGLEGDEITQMADVAVKLYRTFDAYDGELAEINPLVATPDGLVAIDAVFNIDDNACYRQDFDREKSPLVTDREKKASEYGLAYVDLDGEVAIVGCGAGLVMATLDAVAEYGGRPACFLDLGGGATAEDTRHALEIVQMKDSVATIYLNIFGGITQCDKIAEGIIEASPEKPTVIRMLGTNEEQGKEMLRRAGYEVVDDMTEGAKKAVELLG